MYGPSFADAHLQNHGRLPGVCQLRGACKSDYGFFIPYHRGKKIGGSLEQREVRIRLHVTDLSPGSTFSGFIPFVVDSGSDVTIIPRKLLPPNAFPIGKEVDPYCVLVEGLTDKLVKGLTDKIGVVGRTFSASLAMIPRAARYGSLGFSILTVVVVDTWEGEYAILGLDALRKVVTVFDKDHVCFWPMPTRPCQAAGTVLHP